MPILDRIADGRPSDLEHAEAPALEAGRKALAPAVEQLAAAGVPHVAKVLVGDAPHVIVDYARAHHCESIVMGTHGHGAVTTLMLGSTAHKVLLLTHVPVTYVK
jgi:nucleotide-binding universal stress UspA family protein